MSRRRKILRRAWTTKTRRRALRRSRKKRVGLKEEEGYKEEDEGEGGEKESVEGA